MAKAKPTKHTASEIARKEAEATKNKGGGAAGLADRLGGPAGHSRFVCPLCKVPLTRMSGAREHYDAKHPKEVFDESAFVDLHEVYGGTTKGIAVRGTTNPEKLKKKAASGAGSA